ncbi:MAG: PfkB family carbohydrate kinase [Candidatus Peribacteraceae bacterium]|nr:PfkB family carbohydrate kinase [Candidatus Peribacteraceae bacterium]
MPSRRIFVTGSIAYDVLLSGGGSFADALKGKDLNALSVSFVTPHFKRHHGGTASNIAWNIALLGGDPLLVGTVGEDGGAYLSLLRERGIDTAFIEQRTDAVTATAIIATDDAARQISFFHPGADSLGTWPDFSGERGNVSHAIVSARSIPQMTEAIAWCVKERIPYLFDPGQQVHGFSDDELRRNLKSCAGMVVNDFESQLVQHRLKKDESALACDLPFLIVTRGGEGLSLYEKGKHVDLPACKADRVVNPTGAGDAFRGGLLVGMAAGWSLSDAAKLGSSLGSFVVEQEGTLLDRLDTEEVWMRAQQAYKSMLPHLR